jgi:hypothetical protein
MQIITFGTFPPNRWPSSDPSLRQVIRNSKQRERPCGSEMFVPLNMLRRPPPIPAMGRSHARLQAVAHPFRQGPVSCASLAEEGQTLPRNLQTDSAGTMKVCPVY